MPLTNKQIVKNYRTRQRATLGEDEYKRIQAAAKREYRARKKPSVPVDDECDTLLNKIFDKKKALAVKKGKTISLESFKKNTWGNLKKIYKKKFDEEWNCIDMNWLKNADENIAFIKATFPKENTFITYVSSFASITGVLGPQFKKAYHVYSQVSSSDRRDKDVSENKNIMTESEKSKMIPFKDLIKLYKSDKLNTEERALIALYTLIPPRRVELTQIS